MMRMIMSGVAFIAILFGGYLAIASFGQEEPFYDSVSLTILGVGIALGGTLLYVAVKIDELREAINENAQMLRRAIIDNREEVSSFHSDSLKYFKHQTSSVRKQSGPQ